MVLRNLILSLPSRPPPTPLLTASDVPPLTFLKFGEFFLFPFSAPSTFLLVSKAADR